MNNLPLSRQFDLIVQELKTETLIYDLKINKAFCLNNTSAMIWQLCDETNSVEQISRKLSRKLKQPINEDLVWLALDQFKHNNLLENNAQFEINFNGLNRRQIIKKIGFASMVALPVIASLIAPSAAMAQSGPTNLALYSTCTSPGQCASGNCHNNGSVTRCCVAGLPTGSAATLPGTSAACAPAVVCYLFNNRCCSGSASAGSRGSCAHSAEVECICN